MNKNQLTYLKDYKKPTYLISDVEFCFCLFDDFTLVKNEMRLHLNKDEVLGAPLILDGEELELVSLELDGEVLATSSYDMINGGLVINGITKRRFILKVINKIKPHKNKSCEGLYQSGTIFCTQNEPEGFRKISYFIDRPDVMASYKTRIEADKNYYPVLLSNGNMIDSGDLADNRHFRVWQDPFVKPSYLFALVAGDLVCQSDSFVTQSGRQIALEIYVDKGNESRCQFALDSLKRAMRWDEQRFGLEYDLNTYMIVAVDAFNMGAMENKGLNIFNSSCVLADPKMATDQNFQNIEGIIAHEYFHNWTGNRVTCRDWFQLTLKEGLTVYRDQIFSEDMWSSVIKRIEEVSFLRNAQFVEDNGPMSHAIKPSSYMQINNFYTATVYRKGAEVIRMIATLIGRDKFAEGITKYFELFDGQAVTTEDFIYAMELASGRKFGQFQLWYSQYGTPKIVVSSFYDKDKQVYELSVEQNLKEGDLPYHFPLVLNLFDKDGTELLALDKVWEITESKEVLNFVNISSCPIPSLLRNFSAPVKLQYDYSLSDLIFLFEYDCDKFNRYEAGQKLAHMVLELLVKADGDKQVDSKVLEAYGKILSDDSLAYDYKAKLLQIPSITELVEKMAVYNYQLAYKARFSFMTQIAKAYKGDFENLFMKQREQLRSQPYDLLAENIGRRSLRNCYLGYLYLADKSNAKLLFDEFQFTSCSNHESTNMTDEFAMLNLLSEYDNEYRQQALQMFADKWQDDTVVMNKWFAVQALSKVDDLLVEMKKLEKLPYFDKENPNKVRSLYGCFASNGVIFHTDNGDGYEFVVNKIIELDKVNPHIASGLATIFKSYPKLPIDRKVLLKVHLEKMLLIKSLSKDVYEVVEKIINF